ncbi:MAG: YraN family protein [Bacteroidetes bacterium]|nr:YraN family protein [Bacteroidota bacterium]
MSDKLFPHKNIALNQATGKKGEQIAASFLIDNGYEIQEKNWRHHHLEVDIIASKNGRLHIVEVKTRNSTRYGHPEESITKNKMKFLKNAAEAYQYQHKQWLYLQFDVIAITLISDIETEIFLIEDVYF